MIVHVDGVFFVARLGSNSRYSLGGPILQIRKKSERHVDEYSSVSFCQFATGSHSLHATITLCSAGLPQTRFSPRELDREEGSGRTWPNQSRLGSNLAVLSLKLGRTGAHLGPTWAWPNLRRARASWLQLESRWDPTWSSVGASAAEVEAA